MFSFAQCPINQKIWQRKVCFTNPWFFAAHLDVAASFLETSWILHCTVRVPFGWLWHLNGCHFHGNSYEWPHNFGYWEREIKLTMSCVCVWWGRGRGERKREREERARERESGVSAWSDGIQIIGRQQLQQEEFIRRNTKYRSLGHFYVQKYDSS